MASLNLVNLVGRVGQEPKVWYFESGKVKATFSLAVDRRSKNKTTDWFEIEAWGKTAEIIAEYVRKGKLLSIEGSLKIESWSDKKLKVDRSTPKISCNQLQMLGGKKDEQEESAPKKQETTEVMPWDDEDDLKNIPM